MFMAMVEKILPEHHERRDASAAGCPAVGVASLRREIESVEAERRTHGILN
jgi:hypothetical protein